MCDMALERMSRLVVSSTLMLTVGLSTIAESVIAQETVVTPCGEVSPTQMGSVCAKGTEPNILIIMIDDIGPEQFACYDRVTGFDPNVLEAGTNDFVRPYPYAHTPNITSLALDGVRFTRAFASPLCSTTRAQIQTGRYPHRTQIGQPIRQDNRRGNIDLRTCETTIPELLRLGEKHSTPYEHMALFGKWHLTRDYHIAWEPAAADWNCENDLCGDAHATMPGIGWPFYQGIMRNPGAEPWSEPSVSPHAPDYYDWYRTTSDPFGTYPFSHPTNTLACITCNSLCADADVAANVCSVIPPHPGCQAGGTPVTQIPCREPVTEYVTTRQRKDVQQWILGVEADPEMTGPWLAFLNLTSIHGPLQWPTSGDERRLHRYGAPRANAVLNWATFQAKLEAIDTEIGLLKRALSAPPTQGTETIWDRTLVIFLGDNGTQQAPISDALISVEDMTDNYHVSVTVPAALGAPSLDPSPITDRFKGSAYMGGTHIPLIVSGPDCFFETPSGGSNKGKTSGALVDSVDIFDTIRHIAGQTRAAHGGSVVDGISFLPILSRPNMNAFDSFERHCSLALLFSPNGCFPPSTSITTTDRQTQGLTNENVEVTFGYTRAFDPTPDPGEAATASPGIYRLIRGYKQERVDITPPGGPTTFTIGVTDYLDFFKVADPSTDVMTPNDFDNTDWTELSPIDIGLEIANNPTSEAVRAFSAMICDLESFFAMSNDYCDPACVTYETTPNPLLLDRQFLANGLTVTCP